MTTYDVAVVGLGAHGSAAAAHLARRGARVIGIEAFPRGHTLGSSGGRSRVIRLAYFEHPDYVPLLRRAWDLWRALESETGQRVLTRTGGLYAGPSEGELVAGSLRSAREHGLAHETIDADEAMRRFPALRLDPSWSAVWEEQAGWLDPDAAIEAHLSVAEESGATLRFEERALRFDVGWGGVRIETSDSGTTADVVVLTAGAWLSALLPHLAPVLTVERVPLFWFAPRRPVRLPVWIVGSPDGDFYGFPEDPTFGLKIARHGSGDLVDPDTVDRSPRPADEERVRAFVRVHLPSADGPLRDTHVCMYTRTPDGHFVIDRAGERVIYASACSGHGFKFASVVGEILADLALDGRTAHPIGFLAASRPALAAQAAVPPRPTLDA